MHARSCEPPPNAIIIAIFDGHARVSLLHDSAVETFTNFSSHGPARATAFLATPTTISPPFRPRLISRVTPSPLRASDIASRPQSTTRRRWMPPRQNADAEHQRCYSFIASLSSFTSTTTFSTMTSTAANFCFIYLDSLKPPVNATYHRSFQVISKCPFLVTYELPGLDNLPCRPPIR